MMFGFFHHIKQQVGKCQCARDLFNHWVTYAFPIHYFWYIIVFRRCQKKSSSQELDVGVAAGRFAIFRKEPRACTDRSSEFPVVCL